MTKQEMLVEVEAKIKKDIPRLFELREGCILQNEWSKDFFKVYNETENHIRIFQLNSDVPNEQVINKKHISTHTPLIIIGHEIMLNAVLEWIRNCKRKIEFDYKTGYFLDEIDYYYSFSSNHHENAPIENKIWNLSYTYLKDQSEELIKFLYNLTKDE